MKIPIAGIPKNQERRQNISMLISADHKDCGGSSTGIESVRMHNLVGEYLRQEREGKSRAFRKRKTCKNTDHTQPCFCLNLKRFQDSPQVDA